MVGESFCTDMYKFNALAEYEMEIIRLYFLHGNSKGNNFARAVYFKYHIGSFENKFS